MHTPATLGRGAATPPEARSSRAPATRPFSAVLAAVEEPEPTGPSGAPRASTGPTSRPSPAAVGSARRRASGSARGVDGGAATRDEAPDRAADDLADAAVDAGPEDADSAADDADARSAGPGDRLATRDRVERGRSTSSAANRGNADAADDGGATATGSAVEDGSSATSPGTPGPGPQTAVAGAPGGTVPPPTGSPVAAAGTSSSAAAPVAAALPDLPPLAGEGTKPVEAAPDATSMTASASGSGAALAAESTAATAAVTAPRFRPAMARPAGATTAAAPASPAISTPASGTVADGTATEDARPVVGADLAAVPDPVAAVLLGSAAVPMPASGAPPAEPAPSVDDSAPPPPAAAPPPLPTGSLAAGLDANVVPAAPAVTPDGSSAMAAGPASSAVPGSAAAAPRPAHAGAAPATGAAPGAVVLDRGWADPAGLAAARVGFSRDTDNASPGAGDSGPASLLSLREWLDPSLRADPAPGQVLQRLQQAVGPDRATAFADLARTVLPEVTRGIASLVQDGNAEMRLHLRPAELGDVELRVSTRDAVVHGQVSVQQPAIKQLLDSHVDRLRSALLEHGLQLGGFDVNVNHQRQPAAGWSGDDGSGPAGAPASAPAASGTQSVTPVRVGGGLHGVDYTI